MRKIPLLSPQDIPEKNAFLSLNREIIVKKREISMEIPKKASYILESCPKEEHDPICF